MLGHYRLDPYPLRAKVEAYYEDDRFYAEHSPPDWYEKERQEYEAGLWNTYFTHLVRLGGPLVGF